MSKAIVARPVNGITLNSDLEFLLDDAGKVRVFDSPEEAKSFLITSGVDAEGLRHMTIMESCGTCCRCGSLAVLRGRSQRGDAVTADAVSERPGQYAALLPPPPAGGRPLRGASGGP